MTEEVGLVVFAHGSRIEPANEAVRTAAAELARTGEFALVEPAFLELGQPDLAGAVNKLVARGAARVIVVPYFLTLGMHLQRDLPKLVAEISGQHQHLPVAVTPPLDGHPALLTALRDRAAEGVRGESQTD